MDRAFPQNLGDQIFDPYVSTKDTGLGLGLAICRQIVQLHGGQITASNATEGGAVFTVRLPRSDLATDETQLNQMQVSWRAESLEAEMSCPVC